MRGFVKELGRNEKAPVSLTCVFLIGAGASVSSGIPAGAALAETWLKELHELDPTYNSIPFHQWMHDARHGIESLDPKDFAASYSAIFDKRFARNPRRGFAALTALMRHAQPGFGYSVLAEMMSQTKHRATITTNFDSLIERAVMYYTDNTPLTCTDETAAGAFDRELLCPLIVKCHRDLHLSPHNGVAQTSQLHENFGKALHSLLPGKILIVIGYGGNDPSLMGFLEKLPKEKRPEEVYWCYRINSGKPSRRILNWLGQVDGALVGIPGFDELMAAVKAEYQWDFLEDRMTKQHEERLRRYKQQLEQIASKQASTSESAPSTRSDGGPEPATRPATAGKSFGQATSESSGAQEDAMAFASESIAKLAAARPDAKRSGWETALEIRAIPDLKEREAAYRRALAENPSNPDLFEPLAALLHSQFRYADADQVLTDGVERCSSELAAEPERFHRLLADRAWSHWLIGRNKEAEADINRSIAWGEAQFPRNEWWLAVWYARRASVRLSLGNLKHAEEDIARSIMWCESQSPRDEYALAIHYATRAWIRRGRGDWKSAEEDIGRSIKWGEAQNPRNEQVLAVWYAARAAILHARGDLKSAEEDIGRSIKWLESRSPRDDRGLSICYQTRSLIRRDRGDLQIAEDDIARCIQWYESQTPRDERELASHYGIRASIRLDRTDLHHAEVDIARSIALAEAETPIDERSLAIYYGTRAAIRQDRGDLKRAEEDSQRGLRWFRANQPENNRRMGIALRNHARILAAIGNWVDAQSAIDESIPHHEAAFGPDHEWTRKARSWAADVAAKRVPPRWIETKPL